MPLITINPLRDIPGATEATTALFRAQAKRSAYQSAVRVDGADVTFPEEIRCTFTGGVWDVVPELVDLPVGTFWSVELRDTHSGKRLERSVVLPAGVGPFLFSELVDIDPATLSPSTSGQAAWDATLQQVQAVRDEIDANTITATVSPDDPRLLRITYPAASSPAPNLIRIPIGA